MVYRICSSYSLYRINSSGIVSSSECSQLFLPIMSPLQVILVLRCSDHIKAVIAAGSHLFPSRTEKLSPLAPMVLHTRGRVGSRHFSEEALQSMRLEGFLYYGAIYSPTVLIMLYKQFFYVHGQEILCADAAFTDYQCRIRLKIFPECVKPMCAFFRITLHFNRNDAPFFAKYEIDLVISVTPIEHLKTVTRREKVHVNDRFR